MYDMGGGKGLIEHIEMFGWRGDKTAFRAREIVPSFSLRCGALVWKSIGPLRQAGDVCEEVAAITVDSDPQLQTDQGRFCSICCFRWARQRNGPRQVRLRSCSGIVRLTCSPPEMAFKVWAPEPC